MGDIIKRAVQDARATAAEAFDRKDAATLEEVFERLGWRIRYNLRSMCCDWSLDGGSTWGSTNDRLEKKRRRTIAETFTYRTVKDGKKITRPLVYGRDSMGGTRRAQFSRITRSTRSSCGLLKHCHPGTAPRGCTGYLPTRSRLRIIR